MAVFLTQYDYIFTLIGRHVLHFVLQLIYLCCNYCVYLYAFIQSHVAISISISLSFVLYTAVHMTIISKTVLYTFIIASYWTDPVL